MIWLARFREYDGTSLAPILVEDATIEAAISRIEEEVGETPGEMRELPAGLLLCELRTAVMPNDGEDAPDVVPVLEPFADFADWLDEADEFEVVDEATAPTEPAPEGGTDGDA